jgi:hypothetical protein
MENKAQRLVRDYVNLSLFSTWCSHCAKERKVEAKRQRQEEQRRNRERFAREQNELLEKARLEMLQQTSLNSSFAQIQRLANQLALNFFHSPVNANLKVTLEDSVLIYNILQTPKELLVMSSM